MVQTLKNAWKTLEIRNKLFFTFLILVLYRLGASIPVPYVNGHVFDGLAVTGTILDYLNTVGRLDRARTPTVAGVELIEGQIGAHVFKIGRASCRERVCLSV